MSVVFDVVVVGAGAAGLSAAHHLQKAKVYDNVLGKSRPASVVVLEANSEVGGRVRTCFNFTSNGTPVELGAELVHGNQTSLNELSKMCGMDMHGVYTWAHGDGGPHPDKPVNNGVGFYYIGRDRKLLRYDDESPDFKHLNEVLQGMCDVDPSEFPAHWSLAEYLAHHKVSPRMVALAEAGFSNTAGSACDRMPIRSVLEVESNYEQDGDGDFKLCGAMQTIIAKLRQGIPVWTRWRVARIEQPRQDSGVCRVSSAHGHSVLARAVIIAVPVPILKDEDITFVPPLPSRKRSAISRIRVEPALKFFLKFRKRFWPEEMHGMICGDELVPELWVADPFRDHRCGRGRMNRPHRHKPGGPVSQVRPVPASGTVKQSPAPASSSATSPIPALQYTPPTPTPPPEEHVLIAFACADFARRMARLPRADLLRRVLDQCDRIFGTPEDPKPASSSYIDSLLMDWHREPYIRGGYSAPSPLPPKRPSNSSGSVDPSTEDEDARAPAGDDRRALAAPVGRYLFWAGEATALAYGTVHAAIDSGKRAADEVVRSWALQTAVRGAAAPNLPRAHMLRSRL